MKRCFIAIKFPKKIRDEILRVQKALEKQELFYGNYIKRENIHLTLKFFGNLSESDILKVKRVLERIDFGRVDLELDRAGYFSESFIRVVWISVTSRRLYDLEKFLEGELGFLGREVKYKFEPHITIVRVKKTNKRDVFKKYLQSIEVNKIGCLIDRIYFQESILTSRGAEYKTIGEYRLKGGEI